MTGHRHVAVADHVNGRVSVFSVEGEFIGHVGVDTLTWPTGVACSASDELVVADQANCHVVVLSARGELLKTMGRGDFKFTWVSTCIHGGAIFAQCSSESGDKCMVFR